jgi:hypothetical protein
MVIWSPLPVTCFTTRVVACEHVGLICGVLSNDQGALLDSDEPARINTVDRRRAVVFLGGGLSDLLRGIGRLDSHPGTIAVVGVLDPCA